MNTEPLDVALLEDDESQVEMVQTWLVEKGYYCCPFTTGRSLMDALKREKFGLFLIDWELPDINGLKVMRHIRADLGLATPIIFVTNRDSEQDIVAALTEGADDYLIKPLRQQEFLARVTANTRKHKQTEPGKVEFPPYTLNTGTQQINLHDKTIELSSKEFELAHFLFRNEGVLLERKHILASVWRQQADINTRTVDTHMSVVRRKLALLPQNGWRLKSVYGHGYRLERLSN